MESVERGRRDAQLKYVVIYEAACSYCLGKAQRLDRPHLRTFALELKEQLAQALTALSTSILAGPCRRPNGERGSRATSPANHLSAGQMMCRHVAENLAISVLDVDKGGHHDERSSR